MRKILLVSGYFLLLFFLIGCATIKKITHLSLKRAKAPSLTIIPTYSGPKACITVVDFEVNTAKATAEIASGLRQMFVDSLMQSNRFSILERQTVKALAKEELVGTQKKSETKNASLIITATVSEFEPVASGGRAGLGGGGGVGRGTLGTLLGDSLNQAHLALDIRIVDGITAKVLAAKSVQAQASDVSGVIMTDPLGNNRLKNELSIFSHTPMEKAIRICITEAVRYISQKIPASYYKY